MAAPREDEDAAVRSRGRQSIVVGAIDAGHQLGRPSTDGHLVDVREAQVGVGVAGAGTLHCAREVQGVAIAQGGEGRPDAWGLDGVQDKGGGVPTVILGEHSTLAQGGGNFIARIPLADGIQDALGLGVIALLEEHGGVVQAVLIGGLGEGHQHRVGHGCFLVLVDNGVCTGEHAVGLRFGDALDGLAEVVDGVLIPELVEGSLALFEVKAGTPGQQANRHDHAEQGKGGSAVQHAVLEVTG